MSDTPKAHEIAITRTYDAPVKLVWDAWTDPEQVAQWWGPRGFTITTHSKDLRPGGHWDYTMHGPDGVDYPNTTKYFEVVPQRRLVYDHGANATQPALFRVTVDFSESNGKTKMAMRMTVATAEALEEIKTIIKAASGNSTWDRLGEYLEQETSNKDVFFINRTFDAPIDVLFDIWTDPQHVAQWMPPTGFTMQYMKPDIRVGGTSSYSMTNGKDVTMYGRASYLEIERPKRIVYTQQFVDKDGNVSRHPFAPTWPETMLTTVTLTEEGPGQTRATVRWEVYGKATAEERKTFHDAKSGMTQGWTGSFDKLEAYLEGVSSSAA